VCWYILKYVDHVHYQGYRTKVKVTVTGAKKRVCMPCLCGVCLRLKGNNVLLLVHCVRYDYKLIF